MGESDLAGSTLTAAREISGSDSPHGKRTHFHSRPGRFTFASYVDSIKEGFKKISGYKDSSNNVKRKEVISSVHKHSQEPTVVRDERRKIGGIVVGVKRKSAGRGNGSSSEGGRARKKTSFEMFLSTLPKSDPVDRTVVWVHQQPVERIDEPPRKSFTSLPQRGSIVPLPQPPMTRVSTVGYETTVSHCESDRGTHGRGTPPPMDVGQPRLDDLFRQLHVKQEHQARKEMARQGERHLTSRNLRDIESAQVLGYPPGVTPELLPFLSQEDCYRRDPPSIMHNSVLTRQGTQLYTCCCEWADCAMKFLTSRELFEHVQDEHISLLPSYLSKYKVRNTRDQQLICRWRGCLERGFVFGARYKLLIHVQSCHFIEHKTAKVENEDLYTEANDLSPPTIQYYRPTPQDHKYTIHHSRKSLSTKQGYPTERNSLHVTSYPFPELSSSRQQTQETKTSVQNKRGRIGDGTHRAILRPLQPSRVHGYDKYRPSGK